MTTDEQPPATAGRAQTPVEYAEEYAEDIEYPRRPE
jgi:hypothetical protein